MSGLVWSVDSLIIKDNVVFGFGWAFHEQQEIVSARIRLVCQDTEATQAIGADVGKLREDVGHAFPGQARASNSGFVVFGAYQGAALTDVFLDVTLADGAVVEAQIPASKFVMASDARTASHRGAALQQFRTLARRAFGLVKAMKFRSLVEKTRRYLKGRPRAALTHPSQLGGYFRQSELDTLCLIVDHDLGGGANHYRARLVDEMIAHGASVIILSFHVATLTHVLILRNRRLDVRLAVPSKSFLVEAVSSMPVKEVIYNTAVSFARPEEIPELLLSVKYRTGARLKVLAHDFYVACPSHFLIDASGKYCGAPDLSVCRTCLPANPHGFATLFAARDIGTWRDLWGAMLAGADEIVAFSQSTADILCQIYPQISQAQVAVVPHDTTYLRKGELHVSNTQQLRIGVVGQIGFHKGSAFVKALAAEIKRRQSDIKIVVIGTIESNCDTDVVQQTGPYAHDELPDLIVRSGANTMLFPSIWPETFSFVVQELMDLHLPVAAFDFGAPAERLAIYDKGCVLDSMNPAAVLDQLISFHRKTYLAS
ncbi:glycosyltransferase [Achromobacter sp. GG226]|uniref:glycosyltransferase n=1 Tax=Verticiella alkaliphila TaxID=2779529 RepID=UPI001C0AC002|nr:glycosyltransferase [Verticiella sp. GG226]MBU4609193.1 glycosyltransferase [Verticiella sp. GG226]